MRKAMLEAELGDDVFGDDPTVNRLQARAAEIFGFEAALLFPSGTQSNLAALMSHCGRGDEVILGMEAHSYRYEAGGLSVLGSIQPQAIPNRPDGTLDLARSRGRDQARRSAFRAHAAARAGKHDYRAGVIEELSRRRAEAGKTSRAANPSGRRAHLQRRGTAQDEGEGPLRRVRLGVFVPFEGAGRAGGHGSARRQMNSFKKQNAPERSSAAACGRRA